MRRVTWWVLAGGALAVALLGAAEVVATKVLCPLNETVVEAGPCDVVVRGATTPVLLNGQALQAEPFAPPVTAVRVALQPGPQELQVGDQRLRFEAVAEGAKPEHAWPVLRRHSQADGPERCAACHETKAQDGRTTVGALREASCLDCHAAAMVEAIHAHPLEPISHCQTCHATHGALRDKLLKGDPRALCKACHDN